MWSLAERGPVRRLGGEYSFAKMKKGGDTKNRTKVGIEEGRNDLVKPRGVVAGDEQMIKAPFLEGGIIRQ